VLTSGVLHVLKIVSELKRFRSTEPANLFFLLDFAQFVLGCFFEAKLKSLTGCVYICADLCQSVPFCAVLCGIVRQIISQG